MIRKQIYLDIRHQESVRRMAAARGVSEAEVIREAIDAQHGQHRSGYKDPDAWDRALKIMRSQRAPSARVVPKKWQREELYQERVERYGRRSR